jgi:YbbR domain-containing protein
MRKPEGPWPYRLAAVMIAVALWYVIVAEKRELLSEKTVETSVTYNTPKRVVVLDRVTEVQVLVRGRNREIRRLRPYDVDVLVDVPAAQTGFVTVSLTPDNVVLPSDNLSVVSIQPERLTLRLDAEEERKIPVTIQLTGEPAAGAVVVRKAAEPPQVTLAGPSTLLRAVRRVETAIVSLDGHAFSFEKEVPLITSDPLIRVVDPATVTVQVVLEQPAATRGGS